MSLKPNTILSLEKKLTQLNGLRPIPNVMMSKIREQLQIEMAYNTNAIEGNTLSLKETFLVIQEGITVKGKPLKDHLEAIDQKFALEHLYELVDNKNKSCFSEITIRQLHSLVVQTSDRDIAGRYREGAVRISGSDHIPPDANMISALMCELVSWMKNEGKGRHAVEQAAWIHHQMVAIHPFWDGNGRTARLVMNLILMSAGFPMAIILKVDRKRYYRVLSLADKGDTSPLSEFIAQAVGRSLNIYLNAIQSPAPEQKGKSLITLAENCEFSATYLRKLATQGRIEAWKEGRNWLSTTEAVEGYRRRMKKN